MVPKWSKTGPKTARRAKAPPGRPEDTPQTPPRRAQDTPRAAQDVPRCRLEGVLRRLGRVFGPSWRVLARLGRILSRLGGLLGTSFGHLVRSGPDLKQNLGFSAKPYKTNGISWFFEGSGCNLDSKLAQKTVLGAILAVLATILDTLFVRRAFEERLGSVLRPSWPPFGPSWKHLGAS